jgi:putative nucleotidyltransferase-like protein
MSGSPSDLWDHLRVLVDRAPTLSALRAHRVHLFAARCWREAGREMPAELRSEQRHAAMIALSVEPVLQRVRAVCDGTLMLMKGPEAATHHLHPETRGFRDVDLLVDDPVAAHRALIGAGFFQGPREQEYADAQHLVPLAYPGLPLLVELHRRPNLPPWIPSPPVEAILDLAVPSLTGVTGIVAPAAPAHALLLAAHSWSDRPVGRLIDLVDVMAVLGEGDRAAADRLARAWGWHGLWRTTLALAAGVLAGEGRPWSLRTWARHFEGARERTVLEDHIARAAAPAWTVPRAKAPRAVTAALARTTARRPDECWGDKLRRSRLAVRHAFTDQSTHTQALHPTEER